MSGADLAARSPGLPRDGGGPVFREAWEAEAFALALQLHDKGLFTWPEWAQALGDAIRRAQQAGDPDTGATYYLHWLDALESLVVRKGLASGATLKEMRESWDRAARATPHGSPITLDADPARRPAG